MISKAYVQWLIDNAITLEIIWILNPPLAIELATATFMAYGYLRVGSAVCYDALGIGAPDPNPPTPRTRKYGGGGIGSCFMR
ncbi:MAG: hypothetical protein QHH24_07690 [Candidatus Bathyarchaeota archaeon]|nr:hypothetical protein [Candidatus Bathyarchaeota archaeon]